VLKRAEAHANVKEKHHQTMQDSLSRKKREPRELEGQYQKLTIAYTRPRAEAEYSAVAHNTSSGTEQVES
jgi:hypothetical protein